MAVGAIAAVMCLVLVGSGVIARGRRGEPVGRNALIWAAIFAILFALALATGR